MWSSVADVLQVIARGGAVVVMDDESRENEGDVILPAVTCTPAQLALLIRATSGIICAPMPGEICDRLELPPMVAANTCVNRTAFTVSVDASAGISTGVSAADRATTLRLLASTSSTPSDFARPGHIYPLRAVDGLLGQRRGHTEAAVALCLAAGIPAASAVGVIGELTHGDDGTMMRRDACHAFAVANSMPFTCIAHLSAYLSSKPPAPIAAAAASSSSAVLLQECSIPVVVGGAESLGLWRFSLFELAGGAGGRGDHIAALSFGDPARPAAEGAGTLVRVHSGCFTGHVLGSALCDCLPQWEAALRQIAASGSGVALYLPGQEGRGIGLPNKMAAYNLQRPSTAPLSPLSPRPPFAPSSPPPPPLPKGGSPASPPGGLCGRVDEGKAAAAAAAAAAGKPLDTFEANLALGLPEEARDWSGAVDVVAALGVRRVQILSDNPIKAAAFVASGRFDSVGTTALTVPPNPHTAAYLEAKSRRAASLLAAAASPSFSGAVTSSGGSPHRDDSGRRSPARTAGEPEAATAAAC